MYTGSRAFRDWRRGTAAPSLLSVAILAAAVSGCEVPTTPTNAERIAVASGDAQSGTVAATLPDPIVVQVTDAQGAPVAGVTVQWSVSESDGSVASESSVTGASGEASAQWTLGESAGEQQLEASIPNGAATIFTATAEAAAPAAAARSGGDGQRALAGSLLSDSVRVAVTDRFGNPVPGAAVEWAVVEGAGSVDPGQSVTDASGVSATSWRLGPEAGSNVLVARVGEEAEVEFTALAEALSVHAVEGRVSVPASLPMTAEELRVVSVAGAGEVAGDGSFEVEAAASDGTQVLIASGSGDGPPILIGLADGATGEVAMSDSTTVLGLLLMNPYLIMAPAEQRAVFLETAQASATFDQILEELRGAYEAHGQNALDYETSPRIYQLVSQLTVETFQALGGAAFLYAAEDDGLLGPPTIADIEGDGRIQFVNPRFVHYGVGVEDLGGAQLDVTIARRTGEVVDFHWSWPPVSVFEPEVTEYELGNGQFVLRLDKGLDFAAVPEWQTHPGGRATILNTGEGILYVVKLLIGHLPRPAMYALPNHFHISSADARRLGFEIGRGDAAGAIVTLLGVVADNAEGIAYWMWQETGNQASAQFMKSAAGLVGNVSLALKVLGFANEEAPFFYDLFLAPREVTYTLTQSGGTVTALATDAPPTADFTITPPSGTAATEFVVDASASQDDHDEIGTLEFRWDWESDGIWDTSYSTDPMALHTYGETGGFPIMLQVRDGIGQEAVAARTVNVGGGTETADRVKLFRATLPWESQALETVLTDLGFTAGEGAGSFKILGTDALATEPLVPGEDLVIISNDQPQSFYDAYAANQLRFETFVRNGGSLLWEACDLGWNGGSIEQAGIRLPGGVTVDYAYHNWNYVVDPELPLTAGLPTAMDHNYASHERFLNLVDGTTIYTVDQNDQPTLIEYGLDAGWVVMTGQPLEHQYDRVYQQSDFEFLLPRVIAHFTGVELDAGVAALRSPPVAVGPGDRATAGHTGTEGARTPSSENR